MKSFHRITGDMLICLLVWSHAASPLSATDGGFVETSEDILKELARPGSCGATRSFVVEGPTRAITVRVKGEGREENKEVMVQENSPEGVARLLVEFDVDSARLRPASYEILEQLAVALADVRLDKEEICIKGHTDSDGSDEHNLALSYRRAAAVRDYLLGRHGLDPARLLEVGYGEQLPLFANDTATGKQRNRRVEVTLGCPEVTQR